jgi:hypothetical protein
VDLGYQSSVAGVAREGPYMLEKTVDGLAGQGFGRASLACSQTATTISSLLRK